MWDWWFNSVDYAFLNGSYSIIDDIQLHICSFSQTKCKQIHERNHGGLIFLHFLTNFFLTTNVISWKPALESEVYHILQGTTLSNITGLLNTLEKNVNGKSVQLTEAFAGQYHPKWWEEAKPTVLSWTHVTLAGIDLAISCRQRQNPAYAFSVFTAPSRAVRY